MPSFFKNILTIAEVAQSYEGSFDLALQSIDAAHRAQADMVNFQVFAADELAVPDYHYFSLYRRLEMPEEQWRRLFDHAAGLGLRVMANVFGFATAARLDKSGVSAFKIHAADVANRPFLRDLAQLGKPILLSTGGSTLAEVNRALRIIRDVSATEVALILGFQNSPTALEDTHLARIRLIKERFGLQVGYADHVEAGTPMALEVPLLAMAAGADFLEKHINLDRSLKREDYISSLNPDEFLEMVQRLRATKRCIGVPGGETGEGELVYREGMKKKVVARKDLPASRPLTYEDVELLRTDAKTDLWSLESALEKSLIQPVPKHAPILNQNLAGKPAEAKRVVAVLLCRTGSFRLHSKPLQRIGDRTILEHLIAQIQAAPQIHDIILAVAEGAENAAFVQLAKRLGLDYVTGPEEDGLARMIQAAEWAEADTVFRVTTENPFLYLENLEELMEIHRRERADLTVCENLPDGTYGEIIELSALKESHRLGGPKHRTAWVTLYIQENPDRFKVVKRLPPEPLRRPDIRLTVDEPEDLLVMRKIYEAFEGRMPIPVASIIRYLDEHPDIKMINGHIEAGAGRIWQ